MLMNPLPTAWKVDPAMMAMAAKQNTRLMIRRQGTPMEIIFSDALNIIISCLGKIIKIAVPTAMMAKASFIPTTTVSFIRSPRLAP